MKLNDTLYEWMKWLSCIALDALGLCYKTLSGIWGFPFGEEVYNTAVALSVCIGVLIGVSTYQFNKENTITVEPRTKAENTFSNDKQ